MNTVTFRPLQPHDLEQASRQINHSYQAAYQGLMDDAYLSSLPDSHWVPILQHSLLGGDNCLVAETAGLIIGTAVVGKDHVNPQTALLHTIYLSPGYQGKGYGHSFYTQAEAAMTAQGCRQCRLEVLSANHRAIRFYLAHGYSRVSTFTVEENGMILSCDSMEKPLDTPYYRNSENK